GALHEVVGARTAFSRTWELSAGRKVSETTSVPSQWRDQDGSWHLFDPTLREAESGWIGAVGRGEVALPERLEGGPGGMVSVTAPSGDAIHMTVRGRSGVGEVDGDAVTYGDVSDGVDVRVKVTTRGAKEDVILRDAAADRRISYLLQTDSDGLDVSVS